MKSLTCIAVIALFATACHDKQELTAPPPPLRPEPEPLVKTDGNQQKDCEPTSEKEELKPISFDQRSIPEGTRLAEEAKAKLRMASSGEVDRTTREEYKTDAVLILKTALAADPYNVPATYALAGAYAGMGRAQCSLNLLTRLLQLRLHASKKAEVEAHLDKMLGRKQPLDPEFMEMRSNPNFRALIAKMCQGTNDPNCVYGGQRDNRER
ncbi:MAG: hypothetical protein WKG01_38140 [Kofleriaceae bacterium]